MTKPRPKICPALPQGASPAGAPHFRIIRCFADLQPALRAAADERRVSREWIDAAAGFPGGYAGKLLAEYPVRGIGPQAFDGLLGALGKMLLLVDDAEAVARLIGRIEWRNESYAENARKRPSTRKAPPIPECVAGPGTAVSDTGNKGAGNV